MRRNRDKNYFPNMKEEVYQAAVDYMTDDSRIISQFQTRHLDMDYPNTHVGIVLKELAKEGKLVEVAQGTDYRAYRLPPEGDEE